MYNIPKFNVGDRVYVTIHNPNSDYSNDILIVNCKIQYITSNSDGVSEYYLDGYISSFDENELYMTFMLAQKHVEELNKIEDAANKNL